MVAITSFLVLCVSYFLFYYLGGRNKSSKDYKEHWLLWALALILSLSALLNYVGGLVIDWQVFFRASQTLHVGVEYLDAEQLLIKRCYRFSIFSAMWAGYLYNYYPSNTSFTKKVLKIIAYILMSIFIPAMPTVFSIRDIGTVDFMVTFIIILWVIVALLYFSRVKKSDENV